MRAGRRTSDRSGFVDEREYMVEEVVDQWYGPDDAFFKVRADDGNLYIPRRGTSAVEEEWSLEAFRELNP
jgi:hypothetical protein